MRYLYRDHLNAEDYVVSTDTQVLEESSSTDERVQRYVAQGYEECTRDLYRQIWRERDEDAIRRIASELASQMTINPRSSAATVPAGGYGMFRG